MEGEDIETGSNKRRKRQRRWYQRTKREEHFLANEDSSNASEESDSPSEGTTPVPKQRKGPDESSEEYTTESETMENESGNILDSNDESVDDTLISNHSDESGNAHGNEAGGNNESPSTEQDGDDTQNQLLGVDQVCHLDYDFVNVGDNVQARNGNYHAAPSESDISEAGASVTEDEMDSVSESDDSSFDGNDNANADENRPLFCGAHITFKESLLAILTFALTHRLTGLCLSDLLSLISLHCGPNNLCVKTLYKFKSYFSLLGKKVVTSHYYCSNCEVPLASKDSVCPSCNGANGSSFFIEFPIEKQLQAMFLRPDFKNLLKFRFTRVKKNEQNIEDVYDGNMYQQLVQSGFLANPDNLSFFMYFDGISLYKSSNFSVWPLYMSINELSYKERSQKRNMILAGLWFGPSKPNPNLFLAPFQRKLLSLEQEGIDLEVPNGNIVKVKCKLLAAVGDMPAKSTFMRFKQYNAAYSCFNCMSSGSRYTVGEQGSVQVFPYSKDLVLRKNEDINDFARHAIVARQTDPKASIYGVKGPSILFDMLPNMISCMAIDVMHNVFLGVMKLLMQFWFDSQHSARPFSLSALVDIVDERLRSIKPPSTFQRIPLSIKKALAFYKAFDYKVFMLYYSLPVLNGILPQQYWKHHCKLVSAIALLCQESISPSQIDIANNLLHSYVLEFQELYGLRYLGLNVHQLLHLPLNVQNLGPLWVYSCFMYESLNGQISRLVHGSRHAALQICSASSASLNLSSLIEAMNGCVAKDFCLKLLNARQERLKVLEHIDNVTIAVGKYKLCSPVPPDISEALRMKGIFGGRLKYFFRLKRNGMLYCSEMYLRSQLKESSFVEIVDDNVPYLCKIKAFVQWSPCNPDCLIDCEDCPKRFLCIVTVFEREFWEVHDCDEGVTLNYLNKVKSTGVLSAFPIHLMKHVCVHMVVDGKQLVAVPVNSLEVE